MPSTINSAFRQNNPDLEDYSKTGSGDAYERVSSPSATMHTINHSLNKYPAVSVSVAGKIINCQTDYVSTSQLVVRVNPATAIDVDLS